MALKKGVVKSIVNEYYRGPHIREIINEMDNEISYRANYDLKRKMKEYGFTYKKIFRSIFSESFYHEVDLSITRVHKDMVRDIIIKMLEVPPSSTLEVLLIIVHNLRIDDQFPHRSKMRLFEITKEDLKPDYLLKLLKEYEEKTFLSWPYFFVRQKNKVFQRKSKNRKKHSHSRKLGRKKSRRKRKSRSRRYTPLS